MYDYSISGRARDWHASNESNGVCRDKLSICGSYEMGSAAGFRVTDNSATPSAPRNISAVIFVGNFQDTYQATRTSENTYTMRLPTKQLGTHIMAVYNHQRQLSNSPFRFEVILPSCKEYPGKVSDISGQCVCPSSTQTEIGGSCIAYASIIPAVIIPVFACLAVAAAGYFLSQAAKERKLWLIKQSDLQWPDPPEVLGAGSGGMVYRADFRGTPVAVKRFFLGVSEAHQAHQQQVQHRRRNSDIIMDGGAESATADLSRRTSSASSSRYMDHDNGPGDDLPRRRRSPASPYSWSAVTWSALSSGREKDDVQETIKFMVSIRHPCITTVMGGVFVNGKGLCLVLELMELGSLWDCLHNVLFPMDGELALEFLISVSKGINFLHSADPPMSHGDMKSGTA
jgi:hypothetical protein